MGSVFGHKPNDNRLSLSEPVVRCISLGFVVRREVITHRRSGYTHAPKCRRAAHQAGDWGHPSDQLAMFPNTCIGWEGVRNPDAYGSTPRVRGRISPTEGGWAQVPAQAWG